MRSFITWLHGIALTLGGPGLFAVAFLDSSFISLPQINDILVVLMVIEHKERMLYYALMATAGSVAGCLAIYYLAEKGGETFLRKRLHGVPPETRLGPEAYGPERSQAVYSALCEEAGRILACGQAVVADAVFLRAEERFAIGEVARAAGAAFLGFWLEASPEILEERLERRRGDASDATVEVLRSQQAVRTGPIAWRRLDARPREPERVLEKARAALAETLP